MYIRNVSLQNINCFEQIKIYFQSNRQPYSDSLSNWNVILGNNGDGKTTILQTIASCLIDLTTIEKLLAADNWIRNFKKSGRFHIALSLDPHDKVISQSKYSSGQTIIRRIVKGGQTIDNNRFFSYYKNN